MFMPRSTLRKEIHQTKDFDSTEAELFLNVLRTAEALSAGPNTLFRAAKLTSSQYNVLRILRGAGKEGLPCGAIVERMVNRDSDMTRLLDALEAKNLVRRRRSDRDRRVYVAEITAAGRNKLTKLDDPIREIHRARLGHLSPEKQQRLIRLLEEARREPTE